MKKIGIFDPGLSTEGHYLQFNRYIAMLLSDRSFQIFFLDIKNIFEDSLQENFLSSFVHRPVIVEVAPKSVSSISDDDSKKYTIRHPYWYILKIKEHFWYKKIFSRIAALRLDILLITSQGRPTMYSTRPRQAFSLILMTNQYAEIQPDSLGQRLKTLVRATLFQRFLLRARSIFVLEPHLISELEERLPELKGKIVRWLPARCFHNHSPRAEISYIPKSLPEDGAYFLMIGVIYAGKNIDFVLRAYERNQLRLPLIIAGKPLGAYGEEIQRRIHALQKRGYPIRGIFRYLNDLEYHSLIRNAHFLMMPYGQERWYLSSSVLFDAFEHHTPIIAPDMPLFKRYITQYGIGFLYPPGNMNVFIETLRKAAGTKRSSFESKFSALKKDFICSTVQKKFLEAFQ